MSGEKENKLMSFIMNGRKSTNTNTKSTYSKSTRSNTKSTNTY